MSIDFTIDDRIPVPPKRGPGARHRLVGRYPLHKLSVGQSFFIGHRNRQSIEVCCNRATKRTGARFIVRLWEQGGVEGLRVWRVDTLHRQPNAGTPAPVPTASKETGP